jgi:hypothetical protein
MYRGINWFFTLFTGRAVVREQSLGRGVRYVRLISDDEKGALFPDRALEAIVQEAYNRAATKEEDGRARYGVYYSELHAMADELRAVAKGEPYSDPRIKSILEFHKLA